MGFRLFRYVLALLLTILLSVEARAQGQCITSYDVLGLAMYCKEFLAAPKLPGLSTLLNTFGNPLPCIEKRIARGGLQLVQIDLRDATCFRNRVCPKGTPPLTDWSVMLQRARAVNALAVKYPAIDWWVSPFLEHDIKDDAVIRKACDVALRGCPSCRCINSPFSGVRTAGIKLELHGTKVEAFSVSGDGASSFDADNTRDDGNKFQHRIAGESQCHAWWNELNLRCTGEKTFTPPLKRTAKPEPWQFAIAAKVFTSIEDRSPNAPPVCKSMKDLNAGQGEIYKPLAERYCNGVADDGRGNKPMLIIRKPGKRGDRMDIVDKSGKKVGCFAYYGTYEKPGLYRWYVGSCSKQNAWELYRQLKNEWGFVQTGGGACLKFNSLRRGGVYR